MLHPALVQEAVTWCETQKGVLMVGTWCQGQPSEFFWSQDEEKVEPEAVAGCLLVRAEAYFDNASLGVNEHELEHGSLARRALQWAMARLGYRVRLRPYVNSRTGAEYHLDNLAAINDGVDGPDNFKSADEAITALDEAILVLKEVSLR